MIAVIDYGAGNLFSVEERAGLFVGIICKANGMKNNVNQFF